MKRRALLAIAVGVLTLDLCPAADKPKVETSGDPFVGKWRRPQKPKPTGQKVMVIKADGSCYYYNPGQAKVTGTWSASAKDKRKYKMLWAGGAAEYELRLGSDEKLRDIHGTIVYERFTEE